MKKITLLLLLFISLKGFSQTVLMEEKVENDTLVKKIGPNSKHYFSNYISYGLIIGNPEANSAPIKYGNSYGYELGIRYKRKFTNIYAMCFDLGYSMNSFSYKNTGSINYYKHYTRFNNIKGAYYQRLNFDKKRGNEIGKFIDVGAYAEWIIGSNYKYAYKINPSGSSIDAKNVEVKFRRLNYVNPYNYGLTVHLGFNRLIVFMNYRLSNLFKDSYNTPELPKYIAGLQIGLY
jgi:hypothetical protein